MRKDAARVQQISSKLHYKVAAPLRLLAGAVRRPRSPMPVKQALNKATVSAKLKFLRDQLKEVVLHLGLIRSAIVVSVATLKRQNAELDEDVANALRHRAGNKIQDQIERLEEMISALSRQPLPTARSWCLVEAT